MTNKRTNNPLHLRGGIKRDCLHNACPLYWPESEYNGKPINKTEGNNQRPAFRKLLCRGCDNRSQKLSQTASGSKSVNCYQKKPAFEEEAAVRSAKAGEKNSSDRFQRRKTRQKALQPLIQPDADNNSRTPKPTTKYKPPTILATDRTKVAPT